MNGPCGPECFALLPPVAHGIPRRGGPYRRSSPRFLRVLPSALLPLCLALLFLPESAAAYVGPGAGFAFLGSFFALVSALVLALFVLVAWPVRTLYRLARPGRRRSGRAVVRRAVVLGFDGMEPALFDRFAGKGLLPNLSRLASSGTYCSLETTVPPLSPVAWSTFQTGVNPGKHGIFDFLRRDPRTYRGELSSARILLPARKLRFGGFQIPLGKSSLLGLRRSQPFWKILGEHGIPSYILRVPITFPPEPLHGLCLSGMCVPDLLGSQGTCTRYTSCAEEAAGQASQKTVRVHWRADTIRTRILGPPNPFRPGGRPLECPLVLRRCAGGIRIRTRRGDHFLAEGQDSPWIRIRFRAGPLTVYGIVRFHLTRLDPFLDLYMTPVHIDPLHPAMPISHPESYSLYLASKQGPFATLGLAEDTSALNEGILEERAFVSQCKQIQAEREETFWDAFRHLRKGLLVCVFDMTDRLQHMFWRYLDPAHPARPDNCGSLGEDVLEAAYRRADRLVGSVLEQTDGHTLVLVISDHGFRSFRRSVNLNTWLYREGYLAGDFGGQRSDWFEGADWSRSKAYGLGLCGIYLNQKGREASGIVEPGEEARRLKGEIASALLRLRDPRTGLFPIAEVFDPSEVYRGPYAAEGPDLIVAYREGYRTSWESALGRVSSEVFEDNLRPWSGDHLLRPCDVPGVFFSNRALTRRRVCLEDLAPTLLEAFGVSPPPYMDGRPLRFHQPGSSPGPDPPGQGAAAVTAFPEGLQEGRRNMSKKLRVEEDLFRRMRKARIAAGYATDEEFVRHALEKEIARIESTVEEDEVKNRLQGLGYLS